MAQDAMSRVLARTNMISEERMLKHARARSATARRTSHAFHLERLEQCRIHRRHHNDAVATDEALKRRGDLLDAVGIAGLNFNHPTWSPSISSSCASCIGMITNALS